MGGLWHSQTQVTIDTGACYQLKSAYAPSVVRPGLDVKRATSTILTANSCAVSRWIQRCTMLNGPLKFKP